VTLSSTRTRGVSAQSVCYIHPICNTADDNTHSYRRWREPMALTSRQNVRGCPMLARLLTHPSSEGTNLIETRELLNHSRTTMTSDAVHCTRSTNVHESTTHKEGWSGTGKAEGPLGRIHHFESPHGVRSRLASGEPLTFEILRAKGELPAMQLFFVVIHHHTATSKSLRLVVSAIRHRGIASQRVLLVPKLTPGEWRFSLDKVRQVASGLAHSAHKYLAK
jgi:hypothetical protein